jgi:hypothetical protein
MENFSFRSVVVALLFLVVIVEGLHGFFDERSSL